MVAVLLQKLSWCPFSEWGAPVSWVAAARHISCGLHWCGSLLVVPCSTLNMELAQWFHVPLSVSGERCHFLWSTQDQAARALFWSSNEVTTHTKQRPHWCCWEKGQTDISSMNSGWAVQRSVGSGESENRLFAPSPVRSRSRGLAQQPVGTAHTQTVRDQHRFLLSLRWFSPTRLLKPWVFWGKLSFAQLCSESSEEIPELMAVGSGLVAVLLKCSLLQGWVSENLVFLDLRELFRQEATSICSLSWCLSFLGTS